MSQKHPSTSTSLGSVPSSAGSSAFATRTRTRSVKTVTSMSSRGTSVGRWRTSVTSRESDGASTVTVTSAAWRRRRARVDRRWAMGERSVARETPGGVARGGASGRMRADRGARVCADARRRLVRERRRDGGGALHAETLRRSRRRNARPCRPLLFVSVGGRVRGCWRRIVQPLEARRRPRLERRSPRRARR